MIGHGLDPDGIRLVSADMSRAYRTGYRECFPNSTLVIDRFHILKGCNRAVDEARKRTIRRLKERGSEIPQKVEYSLTDTGKSLIPMLDGMCEWGDKHRPE